MEKHSPCRWLKRPQSRSYAAARLICFPHAAAGASSFAGWLSAAPAHLEVWRVQLPGREDVRDEPPLDDLTAIILELADAMMTASADGLPLVLYGHSMGAALANQIARALYRQRCAPLKGLVVSGRRAPQLPRSRAAHHELTEPELIAAMIEAEPHSDLWKRPHWRNYYFNLIRRDSAAVESIPVQEEAIFDLPIVAFHGTRDQWVSKDDLAAWRGATRGPFVVRDYEGGHFDHHNARNAIMAEASNLCGCPEGSFA